MTDYVRNAKGWVAMRYASPIQKLINVNGNQYVFVPKHNLSIAFVKESDVAYILAHLKIGCCGNARLAGSIATQEQVDKWLS